MLSIVRLSVQQALALLAALRNSLHWTLSSLYDSRAHDQSSGKKERRVWLHGGAQIMWACWKMLEKWAAAYWVWVLDFLDFFKAMYLHRDSQQTTHTVHTNDMHTINFLNTKRKYKSYGFAFNVSSSIPDGQKIVLSNSARISMHTNAVRGRSEGDCTAQLNKERLRASNTKWRKRERPKISSLHLLISIFSRSKQ